MNCRACSSADFAPILDLGTQPPANAYLAALDEPEVRYPLALAFCRNCGLAQLRDAQPPDLYRNYRYLTGASAAAHAHWAAYTKDAILPRLKDGDTVVDIGGNDSTLLAEISRANFQLDLVNVDPAANLVDMNEAQGIEFWPTTLDQDIAEDIVEYHGHARVVCANNVLAHTDDPRSLLRAIAILLGDEGTLIAEVHWAKHLVRQKHWDQIYHEHACYYSLGALLSLMKQCGLWVHDVQIVPSQGQSLRVFASTKWQNPSDQIQIILMEERSLGIHREEAWYDLDTDAQITRVDLCDLLRELKAQGKRIIGYGAPAKGNTLLNFCGIGRDQLDYLTDTTPLKQGLYAPGTRLPIRPPAALREDTPDYALLLAWNHRAAILAQERDLIAKGMRFITAMPSVEILEPEDALVA
jgi:SAM-dependent methyltransferase